MDNLFGETLKDWRNQRRMSQLDLGLSANVSARHISFLETGRSKPSRMMVLRLCEELDVPRPARNQLLNSAGMAPAYVKRDLSEQDMEPVRSAVDWMLERHTPYPAIAMDKSWAILNMNKPAMFLLSGMNINIGDSMIVALAENKMVRDAIENIDEVIAHTVARLRTESAHLGGDQVLDTAIEKLTAQLGDYTHPETGVLPAFIPARYRANGMVFSFFSTFSQFGTAEDIALSELKIEMMFPADDLTRDLLIGMMTNTQ
ncbi:helix-turn-helix domain-containing protein [Amylibacter sp. SFDW26]|uniref:MmyB family transcriptional regulator n=1 Tax=Amylibacter sp. SFDW26 TaxID=2652722 RepID=UPI001262A165|nr:helix-turn-helix domain-containing protein [Amylibacter sp. SFDW26]KAB7613335.1 helix-turn-helix domain-containing protein [Amylibacter sp. SFDW26]